MKIAPNTVITLNYVLKNEAGDILDECSDGSFCYLHGASNIIPGLESALEGKTSNETFSLSLEPKEGYGEYNPEMTQMVTREMFGDVEKIEPGMQFYAESETGDQIVITIAAVDGENITIDGNHPLAGQTLNYDISIVDVREATEEEIAHGHVHSHGHHHDH